MKGKWFSLILILVAFGSSFLFYGMLPEQIPVHWGINGIADRYEYKAIGAFLLPFIMVVLFIIMFFIPKLDPKKDNYVRFGRTYDLILNGIFLFLFLFHFMSLSLSLGWIHKTNYFIYTILGVLFIFLGNYMPKVKQNYFIGIRTPWAIADEEVWKKTHRFGGKVFVSTGFLFIGTIFIPTNVQGTAILILLFASLITCYISSYLFFVKAKTKA